MQLIVMTNVDLDKNENENEKCTYIIHFEWQPKIDENVVFFTLGRWFISHWTSHGIFST
jgi:hypothetical protein